MNIVKILTYIIPICLVFGLFILFIELFVDDCEYIRVCQIDTPIGSPEFDCNIIYKRLDYMWNVYPHDDFVFGSHAHINWVACHNDTLKYIEEYFNNSISLRGKKCNYLCCITDGTCHNGRAVNIQGYDFGDD